MVNEHTHKQYLLNILRCQNLASVDNLISPVVKHEVLYRGTYGKCLCLNLQAVHHVLNLICYFQN